MKASSNAHFMASFRSTPRAAMAQETAIAPVGAPAGESHIGTIVDISESGAKIIPSEKSKISVGDMIDIHWAPLPGLQPFHIQGKCVWRSSDQAGLSFTKIEERTRYVLRALVKFHLG